MSIGKPIYLYKTPTNIVYPIEFGGGNMDLPWGDERSRKFVTNVGLITSNGPHGQNVMSAEWTHHVSYNPGLIAVCVRPSNATAENIENTKEFGVSLASIKQNEIASIAGGSSGRTVNKVRALEELGYKFEKAKKINTLLVEGAALQIECKLVQSVKIGSHTIFIGEVVETGFGKDEPLAFHGGKFWKLTEQLQKSSEQQMERMKATLEKNKK